MLFSVFLATFQASTASGSPDTWGKVGASAEAALAVLAVFSLTLAWRAGLFDRKAEKQRRQPQIGFELVLLPTDEAMRTATPPAQLPAQSIFLTRLLSAIRRIGPNTQPRSTPLSSITAVLVPPYE